MVDETLLVFVVDIFADISMTVELLHELLLSELISTLTAGVSGATDACMISPLLLGIRLDIVVMVKTSVVGLVWTRAAFVRDLAML